MSSTKATYSKLPKVEVVTDILRRLEKSKSL